MGGELHRALEALRVQTDEARRIERDPVEFPRRFRDPRDIEVSGLLSACLAYGRADLFKPKLRLLHERLGPSPAATVRGLDVPRAAALVRDIVYRFNVGTDLAVLLLGMGQALRAHGSLEALFLEGYRPSDGLHEALGRFTAALRDVPMAPVRKALGPERGLSHLLPSPLGPGAAKRLNLYLRWMVRGPDAVDFGIWRQVPASALLIPLDTHIARLAKHLGLTRRNDLGWRTAAEITAALRALDAADPVKYDFALCHHGMSGACPPKPRREDCARCPLAGVCRTGRRRLTAGVRRAGGGARATAR